MELKNEILTESLPLFDFANPPTDPVELAKTLVHEMMAHKGVGLSANQLGLPYRAFAIQGIPMIVMFNAKIVSYSETQSILAEGCLSFPGLRIKIKRPDSVRVRFTLPNGETKTETFDGLSAKIVQHEIDHMNGVTFFDRATRFHLDQARRQAARRK